MSEITPNKDPRAPGERGVNSPSARNVRYSQLSAERQRLVAEMSRMGFGRIERLPVQQKQPIVHLMEEAATAAKWSAPQLRASDFVLKRSVVELMKLLDTVGDGVVDRIELRFGLPVYVCVDGGSPALLN